MNIIGKVLANRYEIIGKVGEGGMAIVYKAKCKLLNRYVAIKVLKDEYAQDEVFVKKFKEEAMSAASLTHPNIVSVYDVGTEDGINYIVMELLNSKNLKDYIEEKGKLPINEVLKISSQIASALQAAHRAHIIHRDIKPQNITIEEDLTAKVTDFGIAKITNVSGATITNFGSTVGSVHYFSPEHAKGGYTDEKSDIYSLGVVMYEMATGVLPFDGDSPVAIAVKQIQEEPIPPKEINNKIPDSLNDIILKAMSKNTAIRYQSATDILEDIQDTMEMHSRRKRNNVVSGETQVINTSDINDYVVPNLRTKEPRRIANQSNAKVKNFEEKYKKNSSVESKSNNKKHNKAFVVYIIIMIIIILIFGAVFGPKLYRKINNTNNAKIEFEVPDLKGKIYNDIIEEYKEKGIEIVQNGVEYSSEYEEGKIIKQSQTAGVKSTYSKIEVVVSKGEKIVKVPDVVGKDLKVATYELQDSNGFSIESTEEVNEKVAKGLIFEQEPKAGDEVAYGTTIKLKISSGDGKESVLMPSVIGKTLDEAKQTLTDLKLEVKTKTGEDKNKENGIIIAQNYPQNQELKEGDLVEITVNKVLISKKITINLTEFTSKVFKESQNTVTGVDSNKNETVTNATLKIMASIDGGTYNQVAVSPATITKNDKEATITINGYETVALKIYINDNLMKEQTINLT